MNDPDSATTEREWKRRIQSLKDDAGDMLCDLEGQVKRLEPLAYRCEAHQDEAAGCPCCDAVRIVALEAENKRLRELSKQLALTLHGHNVGDLQRCADHDACIDWRIERDFGN